MIILNEGEVVEGAEETTEAPVEAPVETPAEGEGGTV